VIDSETDKERKHTNHIKYVQDDVLLVGFGVFNDIQNERTDVQTIMCWWLESAQRY